MASTWYYSINGNEQGPVNSRQLRHLASTGRITRDDLVWRIGMANWAPARKVKDLFPDAKAKPPDEFVVERDALTVGEFYSATNSLPNRDVVINYSDGTSTTLPLDQLRHALSQTPKQELIYDTTRAFVLTTLRSKDGWLCLEFGSSFDLLQAEIIRDESAIADNPDARAIVKTLRRIQSIVEVGITREQLQVQIADGWIDAKDFLDDFGERFPKFSELVSGTYDNYKLCLDLWNTGAPEIPFEFSGGGFGLVGAAQGMAVGIGLQSLVNVFNNRQGAKLNDRLQAEFWYAAQKTRVARNVIRNKVN